MSEQRPGFFAALWRFFTFWKLRKALGLIRAADRQFTDSPGGVADAFDIHKDEMVTEFQQMRSAVSELEMVIETDRQELEKTDGEQKELLQKREGAKARYKEAKRALASFEGAPEERKALEDNEQRHRAAFERFHDHFMRIEERQESLKTRIAARSAQMGDFMRQLTKMQDEIRTLPAQKAQAIADLVSAEKIIALNDRLQGVQRSIDRGPIDAVLKKVAERSAEAKISQKLAGADVARQDDEYAAAGRASTAGNLLDEMIAAEDAQEAANTGEVTKKEERPDIG